MTIKKKLYLIVFIACIGLIGEGVFCLIQLDRVYTAANYANLNTVPSIITIDNLSDTIARLRISTWQHVKQRDPALMAEIERTITDLRADADRFLKEYDTYLTDDTDRHLLNQVRAALLQYDGIRQQVLALSHAKKDQEALDMMVMNQTNIDRLITAVENHRAYQQNLGLTNAHRAVEVQKSADIITTIIMLMTMLATGFIGITTTRSILRPLGTLQAVVNRVTRNGDFSCRTGINSQDELGLTALAFDQLLDAQQHAINQVNTVVTHIARGNFEPRVNISLAGDLDVMKQAVNTSAEQIKTTMDGLVAVITALRRGAFNVVLECEAEGGFHQAIQTARESMHDIQYLLDDIGQVMKAVSEGNLTQRVTADGHGDFARLKQNINLSLDTLSEALSLLSTNTHKVVDAANESSGNIHAIAESAHIQMNAIDQIVVAIRQTASSITEVSGSAEIASQKSREAVEIVSSGREKINELVSLVSSIAAHSERINKITGIIEKFANKTNLLSLNAAIEAARAGEHGRGFAVVADEVGKLSVSSAEFTKEIAQLVQKAATETSHALQFVQEVSRDMERIEQGSKQADAMMQRISSALEQQSAASLDIQANAASLNKTAVSNALNSEQITGSVTELTQIAQESRLAVERFRV